MNLALTQRQLDEIVRWVEETRELAKERHEARRHFFGENDPRPVEYWAGAGDATSRRRSFLGYFLFRHRLADGRTPAEVGAATIFRGAERDDALRAVYGLTIICTPGVFTIRVGRAREAVARLTDTPGVSKMVYRILWRLTRRTGGAPCHGRGAVRLAGTGGVPGSGK